MDQGLTFRLIQTLPSMQSIIRAISEVPQTITTAVAATQASIREQGPRAATQEITTHESTYDDRNSDNSDVSAMDGSDSRLGFAASAAFKPSCVNNGTSEDPTRAHESQRLPGAPVHLGFSASLQVDTPTDAIDGSDGSLTDWDPHVQFAQPTSSFEGTTSSNAILPDIISEALRARINSTDSATPLLEFTTSREDLPSGNAFTASWSRLNTATTPAVSENLYKDDKYEEESSPFTSLLSSITGTASLRSLERKLASMNLNLSASSLVPIGSCLGSLTIM